MNKTLDINPLAQANQQLSDGLKRYQLDITDTQIRDGLIHRFKLTYEISHKILKVYLESISPTAEIYDTMPFPGLIRSGNEQGLLLTDWSQWKLYRDMCARTRFAYDEAIALEVIFVIPSFLKEMDYLLALLNEHHAKKPIRQPSHLPR